MSSTVINAIAIYWVILLENFRGKHHAINLIIHFENHMIIVHKYRLSTKRHTGKYQTDRYIWNPSKAYF